MWTHGEIPTLVSTSLPACTCAPSPAPHSQPLVLQTSRPTAPNTDFLSLQERSGVEAVFAARKHFPLPGSSAPTRS